jgi:dolichol kinase
MRKSIGVGVTIGMAVLPLALGTTYGLIELTVSSAMVAVGLFLLCLPKLTKRSLASLLIPRIVPRQKFAHSVGGLLIFGLGMFVGRSTALVFISSCMTAYATYEVVRWLFLREQFYLSKVMDSLGSLEGELKKPYPPPLYAFLGLLVAYALFSLDAASVSAIVLAIGDGSAPVGGRLMGLTKNPLNPNKTIGGSFFGFLAALTFCLVFARPITAVAGCAAGMLVESLPIGIDDNFTVPVAAVMGAAIAGSAAVS